MKPAGVLVGRDLAPFDLSPSAEESRWLADVQAHVRGSDHVVRFGEPLGDDDEDLVVSCDAAGRWQAGRYIGEIRFKGRTLRIEPRLGMPAVERLLAAATNLIGVPGSSVSRTSESFIARLMAVVWCRSFDHAARHGPPAFRRAETSEGLHVRGRLDIRESARLRGSGSPKVASTTRNRNLDNDVARTLVCAARALTLQIGDDQWQTRRAREIVPLLRGAVGARPRLPTEPDLRAVRYTPITRPYQELASLSWRIARLEGFATSDDDGTAEGILLDVAELWELYVLRCVRLAAVGLGVEHGTTDTARVHLLRSRDHGPRAVGRLLPDVLVFDEDGKTRLIADAKYKRLIASRERPTGVDRGDLYQLASYLSRHAPDGRSRGALIYPVADGQRHLSPAEENGPWVSEAGHHVEFVRLPVDEVEAVRRIKALLGDAEMDPADG